MTSVEKAYTTILVEQIQEWMEKCEHLEEDRDKIREQRDRARKLLELMTRAPTEICDHQWQWMDAQKRTRTGAENKHNWLKIDRFFCTKCLEQKLFKQQANGHEIPDWY